MIPDQVHAAGPRLPVVTPCELPDGIQLVYADDRGARQVVAVDDAGLIDFGRTRPFRKPLAYRGQRNFPGWWWSATTRSHVVYESWLERHHIIEADRDARIAGIAGKPFALTWPLKKRSVRHVPDLFCQTFDGRGIVTYCRPARRTDEDFRYKCAVTAAACQAAGWEFRQNRPHEGLSHTWGEGRDLSPNEMFAACVGISGYVPLPLTGDDYMELLPAVLRTVNDYGLTIDNRTYDCKALNPYRRLDSGLPGANKK